MTRPPMVPCPKPAKRVKVRKRLQARREPKAFQHRRIPEYQEWIRGFACIAGDRDGILRACALGSAVIECAHVKSRGAGGDDIGNCVPLCHYHHQQQHTIGIRSFQQRHGLDLYAIAADLGRIYRARLKKTASPSRP